MIEFSRLVNEIKLGLNKNTQNIIFQIFSDMGDYKQDLKIGNTTEKYINGIASLVSSEIIPTQGLKISAQSVQIDMIVPIDENSTITASIDPIRQILTDYFEQTQTVFLVDSKGVGYSVGISATIPTSGNANITSRLGESFTYTIFVYYSFVQNGLNSNVCKLKFNYLPLAYTSYVIQRIPIADSTLFSDSKGSTRTIMQGTTFSISLNVPATTDDLAIIFIDYLLNGVSNIYPLEVDINGTKKTYEVLINDISLDIQGILNGGFSLTLSEAFNG